MRLIDADALKKSIVCSDTDEAKMISTKRLHEILDKWIDDRETIDAVPVVHGRWIELKDGSEECTNCRGLCPHEENYNGDIICNFDCDYCPWCGAKMDLEG